MSPWKPEQSLYLLLNQVVMNLAWALAALAGLATIVRASGLLVTEMGRGRLLAFNLGCLVAFAGIALFMRAWRRRMGAHELGWALLVSVLAINGVLGLWLDQSPLRLATSLTIIPITGVFIQRKRMLALGLAFQLACISLSFLLLKVRLANPGYFAAALVTSLVLSLFIYFMLDALMQRVVTLLARLQQARAEIQALEDCLPICGWCKKVRDDDGFWLQVDSYLQQHPQFSLTHGICPECVAEVKAGARLGAASCEPA